MIAVDPVARPTFDQLLHTSRGSLFPEYFYSVMHDFISSVNDISGSFSFFNAALTSLNNLSALGNVQPRSASDEKASVGDGPRSEEPALPNDSDRRISRLWSEFEAIEPCFKEDGDGLPHITLRAVEPSNSTTSTPNRFHLGAPTMRSARQAIHAVPALWRAFPKTLVVLP